MLTQISLHHIRPAEILLHIPSLRNHSSLDILRHTVLPLMPVFLLFLHVTHTLQVRYPHQPEFLFVSVSFVTFSVLFLFELLTSFPHVFA